MTHSLTLQGVSRPGKVHGHISVCPPRQSNHSIPAITSGVCRDHKLCVYMYVFGTVLYDLLGRFRWKKTILDRHLLQHVLPDKILDNHYDSGSGSAARFTSAPSTCSRAESQLQRSRHRTPSETRSLLRPQIILYNMVKICIYTHIYTDWL